MGYLYGIPDSFSVQNSVRPESSKDVVHPLSLHCNIIQSTAMSLLLRHQFLSLIFTSNLVGFRAVQTKTRYSNTLLLHGRLTAIAVSSARRALVKSFSVFSFIIIADCKSKYLLNDIIYVSVPMRVLFTK